MDKQTFVQKVRGLADKQDIGLKLDDLLGSDISCEGFIGDLINDCGELILSAVTGDKPIPDRQYEQFWNCIVDQRSWTNEDIENLYEVLTSL